MGAARFAKVMATVALVNSVLFLCLHEGAQANEREEDAKKYTTQLRTAKDAKTKITALKELGTLGQIKKSLITPAVPDIYKATEDKDAGVRAAAAEALGKADEPFSNAGEILIKLLKEDKDEAVKIGALRGLSSMGASAKEALPAVREIVKSTASDKKSKLGAAAKTAVQALGGGRK